MNTARIIQEEPKVNTYEEDLAELEELRNRRPPHHDTSSDYITARYGVHVWNPATDKLARQMWMPKGMRSKNKALGQGSTRKAKAAPKAGKVLKMVPKSAPSTRKETDLVDGRKFGKRIVSLRRKHGKRACQHIGKRLMVIAERNIGRGQVFYLAAAYGVMESR